MLSTNVLYYGDENPLPERTPLRAGPLELVWEEGDLRTVKIEGVEALRRIYVAIRDRNWGTVANRLSNVQMTVGADIFEICFDASNREGEIDFTWQGRVVGSPDGTIVYSLTGRANTTFWKSRIGFCVLHPAEAAGSACQVAHVDGLSEETTLPVLIDHHQPVGVFADMEALTHEVKPGIWFETRFEGDLFEMEDQRNWTDASFKTFSTPLRLPYPVQLSAGTVIEQRLTLRLHDRRATQTAVIRAISDQRIHFAPVPDAAPTPLPKIGLGMATHDAPHTSEEVTRLAALQLDHLRVDLRPTDAGAAARLTAASSLAQTLGIGLHVAVFVGEPHAEQVERISEILQQTRPHVAAWLVFPTPEKFNGGSPTQQVLSLAGRVLRRYAHVPLGSGTDADFIFLQRNLPPLSAIDFISYAINPQVHAFDNTSLTETLGCQAATVQTARHRAGGLPIHISPVTLRLRYNPYATAAPPPTPPGELPPQVDVRQMSLYGAGWTLGSVKYLAESGAASVTYYETTGWRGVMERADGSPAPGKFRSLAGGVFPLYHVLADVQEMVGASVLPSRSTNALTVDGIILEQNGRKAALLANFTGTGQSVVVEGVTGNVSLRVLDAANGEEAIGDPGSFRHSGATMTPEPGAMCEVTLPPFATARLFWT